VDLPGGRQARRVGRLLRLGRSRPPSPPLVADEPVPVPGDLSLPGWRVRTRLLPQGAERRETDRWTAVFAVTVAQGLRVGPRRAGDRIALAGMTGHKRLQDLFVDEKVPREERDRRPVFRNDQGVVWVAGLRAAGWAAPTRGPAIEVTVRAVPEPPAPTAGDEGRGGKPL
jgi:tRNA(Ile)-lysidine synthase